MAAAEVAPGFYSVLDRRVDVRAAVRHFVDYWTRHGLTDPLNTDFEKTTTTKEEWPLLIAYLYDRRDVIDALLDPELGPYVARVTFSGSKIYGGLIANYDGQITATKYRWANLPVVSPPVGPDRVFEIHYYTRHRTPPVPEYVRFLIKHKFLFDRYEYLVESSRWIWSLGRYMWKAPRVIKQCREMAQTLIQKQADAEFWYDAVKRGIADDPSNRVFGNMAAIMKAKYKLRFGVDPVDLGLGATLLRLSRATDDPELEDVGLGGRAAGSLCHALYAHLCEKSANASANREPPRKRPRMGIAAPFSALHI